MLTMFAWLNRAVSRRPWFVIAAVALVTGFAGWLAPQAVNDDAIAVDNEPARALERLDEEFGDRQSVVQIVVTNQQGSLFSSAGLQAVASIRESIYSTSVADTLVTADDQPAVVSFASAVEVFAAQSGIDLAGVDDAQLAELATAAREILPPQVAGLADALVGSDGDAVGMILVFQDTVGLDEQQVVDQQRALAQVVADVALPVGVRAETFSFGLLLTGTDIGPEIGRLFGTALLIILVVLALIYWIKPQAVGRVQVARRTAADVGITLAVIVLAVVWMQGIGVLLGPGFLEVIGAFSPQTQIVPILIVGLGVDFAIHLLARYRVETAVRRDPVGGLATSMRTVAPTLLLCTAATAIGFLANLASPVDFLATLGVLAAAGISAAFVLSVTLLPAVRVLLDRRAARKQSLPFEALSSSSQRGLPTLIGRTAWLAERAPVATVAAAVLVVAVGAYGFTQLDTEFELTDFVPQDEPLLATFSTITDSFGGGFEETTQVLLVGAVSAIAQDGTLDEVVASLAMVDRVERFGQQPDATVTLNAEGTVGRVEVRTSAGQGGARQLEADLSAAMTALEAAGVQATVTSQQIVQAQIGEDIEDSQIVSLLIALAAAMALLAVHFGITIRRPLLGVVTVAPVVLVLAATFGTMALTGIPLNAVTATLAALSIGIGVPFTIHVAGRFLEEREGTGDTASAMRRTVTATGGALAGSALTTAIGFGVLVTSTLKPFEQLGYVIVYAIIYSFVAAVLVLPSLLVLWDRSSRRAH